MSNSSHPLPPKKDVAMALLQGPSVFIHLDPRKPQVVVPAYFKKQPQLVLQVGLNMQIPIPDLKVDDEGVTCTLSFNRRPFWCKLPWSAIYALVGEATEGQEMKGMLWPEDVPAEIPLQSEGKPAQPAAASGPKLARPPRESKRKAAVGAPPPSEPRSADDTAAKLRTRRARPELKPGGEAPPVISAEAPSESAEAPRPPRETGKSGKRELPPYLRVVK